MSKLFVTSDTHFGNANIIRYCGRPFASSNKQTETLIINWNSKISDKDTVIVTGDFIMGEASNVDTILPLLNGHIILVRGNHDTPKKIEIYRERYPHKVEIHDIFYQPYKGFYFIFCHFPITNLDFAAMVRSDNSEIVFVHGHVHDKAPFFTPETHSFNVSVDVTNFAPVDLDKLATLCREDFVKEGVI